MLYSVVLNTSVTQASGSGKVSGHHLLGLFLNLIERVDDALAAELHRDSAVKPFTLSRLPHQPPKGKAGPLKEGAILSFRVTLLDERVFAALADAVWRQSPETELPLGGVRLRCRGLATTPADSPWAGFATFKDLVENARTDASICLDFLSPTTFRSSGRGERNILFPEPALVFGSLLNRWNTFTGDDSRLALPGVSNGAIRISSYHLATGMLEFRSYRELGFTGWATYECSDDLPSEHIRALNALADFAFYAGVGAKTTMGMGQCRRQDNACAVSGRTRGYPGKRG